MLTLKQQGASVQQNPFAPKKTSRQLDLLQRRPEVLGRLSAGMVARVLVVVRTGGHGCAM